MSSDVRAMRRASVAVALLFGVAACASARGGGRAETGARAGDRLSERERVAHVLSRLTFGARSGDAERVTAMGVDIGSRNAKAVLLHQGKLHTAVLPTGINMQETAGELLEELFATASIKLEDIAFIVGTGYGRVSLKFTTVPAWTTPLGMMASSSLMVRIRVVNAPSAVTSPTTSPIFTRSPSRYARV